MRRLILSIPVVVLAVSISGSQLPGVASAAPEVRAQQIQSIPSASSAFAVIGTIPVDDGPAGLAVSSDDTVYVTHYDSGAGTLVSVLAPGVTSGSAVGTLTVPQPGPLGIAVSADDTVYVGSFGSTYPFGNGNVVSIFNAGRISGIEDDSYSVGAGVAGIAVSADDTVYSVSFNDAPALAVRGPDGSTTTDNVSSANLFGVAVDDSGVAWISQPLFGYADSNVLRRWNGSFSGSVTVGQRPRGVTLAADGSIWVANQSSNSASRIAAGRTLGSADNTVLVGSGPWAVAQGSGNHVLVSNYAGGSGSTISVINTDSIGATADETVTVGTAPSGLATTSTGLTYVANAGSASVSVLADLSASVAVKEAFPGETVAIAMSGIPDGVTADDTTILGIRLDDTVINSWTWTDDTVSFTMPDGTGRHAVILQLNGGNEINAGYLNHQPSLNVGYTGFGTVTVDDSALSTLYVTNDAAQAVTFGPGALVISGDDSGDFTLINDNCSSNTLAPAASCTAQIEFLPTAAGSRSAILTIVSDAYDSPAVANLTAVASAYPLPPGCPARSNYVINLLYLIRTDGEGHYADGTQYLGPSPTMGVQTLNLPGSTQFDLRQTVSTDDSQATVIATSTGRIGGSTQTIDRREYGMGYVMNYGTRYYVSYRLLDLAGNTLACSPVVSFKSALTDASAYVQANYVDRTYPVNTNYNTKGVGVRLGFGCSGGGIVDCLMFLGANPYAPGGLFYQAPDAPVVGSVQSPTDDSIAIEINVSDLPEIAEVQFTTDDGSTWDRGKVQFTTVDDSSLNDATPKADIRAGSGTVVIQAPSSGGALSPSSTYKVRVRSVNNDPGNAEVPLTTLYGTATNTICVQPGTGQVSCPATPPPGGGGGGGAPAPVEPSPSPDPSPVPSPGPVPVTGPVPPGTGQVVVDGVPQDLRLEPVSDRMGLVVVGEGFELDFTSDGDDAQRELVDPDGALSFGSAAPVTLRGNGYAPGSELAVYLVDSPDDTAANSVAGRSWWARAVIGGIGLSADDTDAVRDLGAVLVDDSGAFVLDLVAPDGTPAGDYVLQVVGTTAESTTRALSLGVRVLESPVELSLSISGSREVRDGRKFAIVRGSSTGLEGVVVFPRVKLRGQTSYADGKARRVIAEDGSFDWQRGGGKKLYVYFMTQDQQTRSNGITIR